MIVSGEPGNRIHQKQNLTFEPKRNIVNAENRNRQAGIDLALSAPTPVRRQLEEWRMLWSQMLMVPNQGLMEGIEEDRRLPKSRPSYKC